MKTIVKDNVNNIHFDSVYDFFKYTDLDCPPATMNRSNKSDLGEIINSKRSEWRYGDEETRDEYFEHRFNPEKGKYICQDTIKSTIADKEYRKVLRLALTYKKSIKFDDAGCKINVSKAISGEDRCFVKYKNAKKPIVKIAINICGSACVDSSSFRRVAETAVPTIFALETAGISTEVYYTSFSKDTHTESKYTAVHVKIKSAEQRFNWTTFAPVFTLGSYRHSIFTAWLYDKQRTTSGLGRPMDENTIEQLKNFGYSTVIGLNAQGPVKEITSIFDKIKK